ncbi:bifunctional riboflavin kinase/FMN adenylyltransferase [Buchnera aphidicola (Melanaphis sacchari)]|uniref:Riboflavin biosynthesis protein n=1 Tax=Buchnera aphidicola (Melanaphis sacchari) TaxID=2173854 RepID=A0A2U8DFP6_9GAMM|nr:bifunctional riboflavin kinase/FAD synthetase [Buchnera aphidicola]AWH90616.1 bifunctional riboflavin kinase/FMN adenylyltransferase [Buchnera aphidicola (Melanaphis sacchari)]
MKLIRNINNTNIINPSSIVSIGNFDGMHLGHQKIFSELCTIGKTNNISKTIIIFEPQPLEFLNKKKAPKRLMQFQQKIKYIQKWKIDTILCIKFNKYFSSLSPEIFIEKILIKKLNTKYIIIGEDFKFGSKRHGNISLLKKLEEKYQFKVIEIPSIYKKNNKVSSTNIRKYLIADKIELARSLLGRPFSILGRVIHGNKIGRKIGYPTANILLYPNNPIQNGVYAVKVSCFQNIKFIGVCNIGIKKNYITQKKQKILEVHLFDTNINLYEKKIEIFLYKKIRNEFNFSSIKFLKNQISKDVQFTQKYFKKIKENKKKYE